MAESMTREQAAELLVDLAKTHPWVLDVQAMRMAADALRDIDRLKLERGTALGRVAKLEREQGTLRKRATYYRARVDQLASLVDHATAFMFPVDPTVDLLHIEMDSIFVEWRGDNAWCVSHRQRWVMGRGGEWEYEPQPSERTPEFVARTRFPRDEAIRLARAEVERRRAPHRWEEFGYDGDHEHQQCAACQAIQCETCTGLTAAPSWPGPCPGRPPQASAPVPPHKGGSDDGQHTDGDC